MAQQVKTVRVVANANNKNFRTVNIVTTKRGNTPTLLQATGADKASHLYETVQDSGGTTVGARTIHIAGYSGPS